MEETIAPLGNFFRSLKLKTRLELEDEKWVYTEEPHVERRKVRHFMNFYLEICSRKQKYYSTKSPMTQTKINFSY